MAGNATHVGAVQLFEGICVSVRCRGDKRALVGRSITMVILSIGGWSRDARAFFGDVRCLHAAFIGMNRFGDKQLGSFSTCDPSTPSQHRRTRGRMPA